MKVLPSAVVYAQLYSCSVVGRFVCCEVGAGGRCRVVIKLKGVDG